MSRSARATVIAPAPMRLGEETLSPAQIAEAEKQEAARSILSRRAHRICATVDELRDLADGATDARERRALWAALAAARQSRDIIVEAFNQVRAS